jgi:hypothetical protein
MEPEATPKIDSHDIQFVEWAVKNYHHAETITQTRLYNFLMADSILLLSWATIFAASGESRYRPFVLACLAVLSLAFSWAWAIFGRRHRKFLKLHIFAINRAASRHADLREFYDPGILLQMGQKVEGLELTKAEEMFGEQNLGVWAPGAFTVFSLILLVVSLCCS